MSVKDDFDDDASKPGAPALEKGLDILEMLSGEPDALSQKEIAQRLGRSVSQIHRMLGALEDRGYLVRDPESGHYRLTLRLFELAHRHPPTRRLQQAALAAMNDLSQSTGHACHLVVPHADRLAVVAQMQPERLLMGWSVKVGAVFPFDVRYASARVIGAFQASGRAESLLGRLTDGLSAAAAEAVKSDLERIRISGMECAPSAIAPGVTDISCPVTDHFGNAVAALTVPFVPVPETAPNDEAFRRKVRDAAAVVTHAIGGVIQQ